MRVVELLRLQCCVLRRVAQPLFARARVALRLVSREHRVYRSHQRGQVRGVRGVSENNLVVDSFAAIWCLAATVGTETVTSCSDAGAGAGFGAGTGGDNTSDACWT